MELYWAEKIAVVEDQSSKICRACGEKMTLIKLIADSDTGAVIHMFACSCGDRAWSD